MLRLEVLYASVSKNKSAAAKNLNSLSLDEKFFERGAFGGSIKGRSPLYIRKSTTYYFRSPFFSSLRGKDQFDSDDTMRPHLHFVDDRSVPGLPLPTTLPT